MKKVFLLTILAAAFTFGAVAESTACPPGKKGKHKSHKKSKKKKSGYYFNFQH